MSNSPIRFSRISDLTAIKGIIDSTKLFPSEYLDDMFSESSDTESEFWLTYDYGGPVAVAYCVPEPMTNGTSNLLLIAVHQNNQGAGIGQELMVYIEDRLRNLGVRVLLVETSGTDEFARTRTFYEKLGYENEARIREYYDVGDDKIIYRKAL